jgi:phosphatidylglycerophosphate synthase
MPRHTDVSPPFFSPESAAPRVCFACRGWDDREVQLSRKDLLTVPNGLTLARLVMTPWVVKRLHDDPATWPVAAAFAFSDNFDGILARAGDSRPRLARLGFRTSEFGRKADPLTDKVFTAAVVAAGMHNGVIPVALGAASLVQKAAASAVTVWNEAHGVEMAVTRAGKRSEFATNMAYGVLFIATGLSPQQRRVVRPLALAVGVAGVAGASYAAYTYWRDGRTAMRH